VTLISYTHLAYLIRNKPKDKDALRQLWESGKAIAATKDAATYWSIVNKTVGQITGTKRETWQQAEQDLLAILPTQAEEQVLYWEREKARISKLPHDQAVKELIKALKIDRKITTIRRNARL
jgi:hypothetical protein